MSVQTQYGWTTIDAVIRSWIADQKEATLHKYIWALHYALEGYLDFMMDTSHAIKTKRMKMGKTRSFQVPSDYIFWTKIGIKKGDRIWGFVRDASISLERNSDAQANSSFMELVRQIDQQPRSDANYDLMFLNSQKGSEYYGRYTGHNGVGYFREHQVAGGINRIQFSSDVPATAEIILEYVGSGIVPGAKTAINTYAVTLIKRYIDYKFAAKKYGESHRETIKRWEMYGKEIDHVEGRQSDFTFEGIMDAKSRAFNLGPKI